jgi:hypothetical protein
MNKKLVIGCLALLLLGCGGSAPPVSLPSTSVPVEVFDIGIIRDVIVFHDEKRGVTCYVYESVAISCLPDSQLKGR